MNPFGQTVLLWRRTRGLTQAELAKQARIARPNLSAIERGKREVSLRTLRALALGLGVRPGVLVDGISPQALGRKPARLSRQAFERVADGVVRGTPVSDARERALVDVLRRITAHPALASRKQWSRPRRGKRMTQMAWLVLESGYPSEVVRSLLQRIADRLSVP